MDKIIMMNIHIITQTKIYYNSLNFYKIYDIIMNGLLKFLLTQTHFKKYIVYNIVYIICSI